MKKNGSKTYADEAQVNDVNLDVESDDWLDTEFSIGYKVKINLADMNTSGWKIDLQEDHAIANDLLNEIKKVTPEHDKKLQDLKQFIANKVNNLINDGNKKNHYI